MKKLVFTLLCICSILQISIAQNNYSSTGNSSVGTSIATHSLTFGPTSSLAFYGSTDSVNYSRVVGQFQSGVYTIGSYFKGTGTLAPIKMGVQTAAGTTVLSGSRIFTVNPYPAVVNGIFDFNEGTSTAGSVVTLNTSISSGTAGAQQNMLAIQGNVAQTVAANYTALLINPYIAANTPNPSGNHFLIDAGTSQSANGMGTHTSYMVLNDAGKLGIGTTIPRSKVDVVGTSMFNGTNANIDIRIDSLNYLANSGQMLMGWNRTQGQGEADFITNQGIGSTGGFAFYNHDNSNTETQLMCIQGNGNVGIGTTSPGSYKLAVAGGVHAQQVNVDLTGWSDYVFDQNYALPSLNQVKNYIDKNHHLPEVPSAGEMVKNGLDVATMNTLLVKKVEELTLYLIEKDKQINEQEAKQKDQDERIKQLEAQLQTLLNKRKQ